MEQERVRQFLEFAGELAANNLRQSWEIESLKMKNDELKWKLEQTQSLLKMAEIKSDGKRRRREKCQPRKKMKKKSYRKNRSRLI